MELYYDKSPLIPEYTTIEELQSLINVISECNNVNSIVGIYDDFFEERLNLRFVLFLNLMFHIITDRLERIFHVDVS